MEKIVLTPETFEARREREHRERIERERAALQPLKDAASVLVKKLGGSWDIEYIDTPNKDWPDRQDIEVRLVNTGGAVGEKPRVLRFEADYSEQSQRVVVSARLPEGVQWKYTPRGSRPEATYAPERGVAGLANALKRIIDDATTWTAETLAAKERDDTYTSTVTGVGDRLAKIPGLRVSTSSGSSGTEVRLYAYITRSDSERSISVDGQVYGEDVTLSLRSLPVALAEKVLKLIAKGE